jgi:hypothetical protein|tara:strand:+ start:10071 stop:10481 length:411 start_codon:yes stop_codon:yes gene_type:complete
MAARPSISKLKKQLDKWFSLYIRLKDSDGSGYNYCYTCNKRDYYKYLQNGHFISRRYLATRFDEENCKPQCPACNVFRYGEQYRFGQKLGKKLAESLQLKSKSTIKIMAFEYEEKISYYKSTVNKLIKAKSNNIEF